MTKWHTTLSLICYFLLTIVLVEYKKYTALPYVSVKILDVGQGDAVLITSSNGNIILIDGGPDYELDRYLFAEHMLTQCTVEVMVLTHPHMDHLVGLNRVLQRCIVKQIFFTTVEYDSQLYSTWQDLVTQETTSQNNYLVAGDRFSVDGIDFYVLWPTEDYLNKPNDNVNNASIVLFMDYGKFEGIFLGDAEHEALAKIDITRILPLIDGKLDVYKVSHHGSQNGLDQEVVRVLDPAYAVVSVGQNNSYGHPSHEVVEFFERSAIPLYRTDKQGTIEFKIY